MAYVFNFTISFHPKSRIYAHFLIQTLSIDQLGMPLHIRHARYKPDDARRVKCRNDVSRQPGPEERLFLAVKRGDVVASFGVGDGGEEILGGWVVNKVMACGWRGTHLILIRHQPLHTLNKPIPRREIQPFPASTPQSPYVSTLSPHTPTKKRTYFHHSYDNTPPPRPSYSPKTTQAHNLPPLYHLTLLIFYKSSSRVVGMYISASSRGRWGCRGLVLLALCSPYLMGK